MSILAALPVIGSLIDKFIPDPNKAQELKAQIETAALAADAQAYESQGNVVTAEAQGESWMQRNWRPSLMYFLMFVIAWHILVVPVMSLGFEVSLDDVVGLSLVPKEVWTLLTVGMGGYIMGRSGEKMVRSWRGGE